MKALIVNQKNAAVTPFTKKEIFHVARYHGLDARYSGNKQTFYIIWDYGQKLLADNVQAQIESATYFKVILQQRDKLYL